jgi:hypothetical protein
MDEAERIVPDFVVIGAAKSGTTSAWRWLRMQPDCFLPSPKEVDFFSSDENWERGLSWYRAQFAAAGAEQKAGEVSPNYTSPDRAAISAERMAKSLPNVKVVFLARNPIERMRSHYRHEVQRGRERRPLAAALAEPSSPYVRRSLYSVCLEPYMTKFPDEQIAVVRFEDLVDDAASGWAALLSFLGLEPRPRPEAPVNATSQKRQFRGLTLKLYETKLLRLASRLPGPVRRAGKRVLTRGGDRYQRLMAESRADIPAAVERQVWEDADRLGSRLGVAGGLWHGNDGNEDGARSHSSHPSR